MPATTAILSETSARTATAHPLRRSTVAAGLAGAAVATVVAAAVHAVGVSFEIEGETIPLLGFAQMTFIGAVVGGLALAGLNCWSWRARARVLQATVALTVVSCVPSLALPVDTGSRVALVALHLLAAAIIVPALARHARS